MKTYIIFLLLVCMDILALIFTLKIAMFFRADVLANTLPFFNTIDIQKYYWILVIILFIFIFEKIYIVRYDFWSDTKRVLKSLLFSFLAVFTVITLTKMADDYSRTFILLLFILAAFILPISKRLFKRLLFSFDIFRVRVKVVANSSRYETIYNEIEKNWYFGFKNSESNYDMVIISSKGFSLDELQTKIKNYTKKTKDIYVIPYMDHLDFSHASIIDYANIRLSAIHIENRLLNYKNIFIKYLFEKALVLMIFPFALILHIFISLLIKADSNGSVLFKQKRLGRDSKEFKCYKYRTMHINNDDILNKYLKENPEEIEYYNTYHKYQNDPRITKIGSFLRKTSLDEFPQFYNILKGDMNLIGPRPYMISEKEKIGLLNEEVILKTNPGITGLWQVSGRNELTFHKRVELDVWYIQNWSLWMDFVIFMKTIKVVLSKVGAK
ncbi:MAG: UDP-phosphate galactose phosphotransferase [Sulfurimonas sp.]|nr:MAG: UDP-phosphate galactose phosphotransferase [Sulfurimonas sp.]